MSDRHSQSHCSIFSRLCKRGWLIFIGERPIRKVLIFPFFLVEYETFFSYTDTSETVFWTLDTMVWILTIFYILPLIKNRIERDGVETKDGLAFIISIVVFWLAYLINYVIMRILISLPLGRDAFGGN